MIRTRRSERRGRDYSGCWLLSTDRQFYTGIYRERTPRGMDGHDEEQLEAVRQFAIEECTREAARYLQAE